MSPLVVVGTSDIYLQSEINEVAKSEGFETRFVTKVEEMEALVNAAAPKLVVLDLSSDEYDPFSGARSLKTLRFPPRILGFFPHVKTELATQAKNAGVDYVVPNSGFLKSLRRILEDLAAK